ncbi:hypothetical protein SAY87_028362 [Trapa incisa]|uniref:Uncharacterized protein n=1 Tax=Trapa incisa TaxID=236973 RepID=A0AAN7QRI1_9MYRT|nr:hypothetical protein SAY87_028362 [Trapa incisa]
MSAACETKHDSPVTAGGSGSGEIMLFGVRLLVDSMRKSVSLNNLSQYMHPQEMYSTGNGNAAAAAAANMLDAAPAAAAGYASMDEAAHNSSSIGRERKRGVPWTEEEHRLFLVGLERVGKGDWRGISRNFVKTRTPTQVASHAQKYFLRRSNLNRRRRRSSLFDITVDMVAASPSEKTLVPRRDNLTMKHPLPPATTTLEAGLPTMASPLPMPVILPHSLENPSRNLFPGQATEDRDSSNLVQASPRTSAPKVSIGSDLSLSLSTSMEEAWALPSLSLNLSLPSAKRDSDMSFRNGETIISVA